jgi:hypothetical protein
VPGWKRVAELTDKLPPEQHERARQAVPPTPYADHRKDFREGIA